MRKDCDSCKHEEFFEAYCDDCYYGKGNNPPTKWEASDWYKPDTNGEHIRNMTDEELAKWISGGAMHSDSACSYCEHNKNKTCTGVECAGKTDAEIIMEWLQKPVEE